MLVTVLGQERKLIVKHSYLIYLWCKTLLSHFSYFTASLCTEHSLNSRNVACQTIRQEDGNFHSNKWDPGLSSDTFLSFEDHMV